MQLYFQFLKGSPYCSPQWLLFSHSAVSAISDPIDCRTPGIPVFHQNVLKLMAIESVMPSNHLNFCHPFSSWPQSFPASGSFPIESAVFIMWPKYWSFKFSISSSNEYSVLISFRIDWSDLLAVQGTLKSLIQHHSLKASIIWCSAFLMVQLSHPYMTTGKAIDLTRWIFVGKVISLLFNMLSSFVITFLPRNKCLLISWLQSNI